MIENARQTTEFVKDVIDTGDYGIRLKEYYGDGWSTAYSTIEEIHKIFSGDDDLSHIVPELIIFRHSKGDNVIALNVRVKNLDNDLVENVYIQIKSGAPTWEDYADITYGDGKTADLRVLVFDEYCDMGYFVTHPGDCIFMGQLVDHNNKCSFPTALLAAKIKQSSKSKGRILYTLFGGPDVYADSEQKQLPTKRELLEADFIFNYYDAVWGVDNGDPGDISFDEFWAGYSLKNHMGTEARWNDNGLFLSFYDTPGSDKIRWIYERRHTLFDKEYLDCPAR